MHCRTIGSSILLVICVVWAGAAFAATDAAARMPSAMDERVRACTSCHGVQGQGLNNDYFPRIAGKPADYLFNQLTSFRDGGRTYPPMGYLLAFLPDDYLRKISQYFADLQPPYPNADHTATSRPRCSHAGQRLVTQGDPARKIPACTPVMGALTGTQPGIPGLLGLHASYIAGQMGTWRSGTRHALAPDCMHSIAVKLTDKDITAVSSWLARQPRPADPRPAPATAARAAIWHAGVNRNEADPSFRFAGSCWRWPPRSASCDVAGCSPRLPQSRASRTANGNANASTAPPTPAPTSSSAANIWRAPATASPAIPRRAARCSPAASPWTRRSARCIRRTSRPDAQYGIGTWSAGRVLQHDAHRPHAGRQAALPRHADRAIHQGHARRLGRDLRLSEVRAAGARAEPQAHAALPVQPAQAAATAGARCISAKANSSRTRRRSVEWNRGAYLVEGLGHCTMCHTKINMLGGSSQRDQFAGGLIPVQNWYAPSLTSDKDGGLGDWSIKDIVDLLQAGISDRGAVYGPMAEVTYHSLQYMTDDDIKAMAVYLKTLPDNDPGRKSGPSAPTNTKVFALGGKIYADKCALCHGAERRRSVAALPAARAQPVD